MLWNYFLNEDLQKNTMKLLGAYKTTHVNRAFLEGASRRTDMQDAIYRALSGAYFSLSFCTCSLAQHGSTRFFILPTNIAMLKIEEQFYVFIYIWEKQLWLRLCFMFYLFLRRSNCGFWVLGDGVHNSQEPHDGGKKTKRDWSCESIAILLHVNMKIQERSFWHLDSEYVEELGGEDCQKSNNSFWMVLIL
jgi:hypothetical protein